MAHGTLLYAQSGGVTAVINASAAAVISQARASKIKVLAARNGILGALREELVDTTKESAAAIAARIPCFIVIASSVARGAARAAPPPSPDLVASRSGPVVG